MNLEELMKAVSTQRSQIAARSGKNNTVKPPPGKSTWRILPGWREETKFSHDFAQHWVKNAKGEVKGVILCEKKTFGRECECCDQLDPIFKQLKAAGIDNQSKTWRDVSELNGKLVVLVNALRVDGDNKNMDQPVVLELKNSMIESYLAQFQTMAGYGINILDPKDGRDVVIERTGTGFDTKYSITVAPIATAVSAAALANRIDIDAWVEAERLRSPKPGMMITEAEREVLGGGGPAPLSITPPAASLVPSLPSRVIEASEPSVHGRTIEATATETVSAPTPAPAVASAPKPSAAPAPNAFDNGEMSQADLDALISSLD